MIIVRIKLIKSRNSSIHAFIALRGMAVALFIWKVLSEKNAGSGWVRPAGSSRSRLLFEDNVVRKK